MNDKTRWYAEVALDALCTWLLGWLVAGPILAAFFNPGADAGDFDKLIPLLIRIAATYGVWKLFRSFNWLKGVPPKSPL